MALPANIANAPHSVVQEIGCLVCLPAGGAAAAAELWLGPWGRSGQCAEDEDGAVGILSPFLHRSALAAKRMLFEKIDNALCWSWLPMLEWRINFMGRRIDVASLSVVRGSNANKS